MSRIALIGHFATSPQTLYRGPSPKRGRMDKCGGILQKTSEPQSLTALFDQIACVQNGQTFITPQYREKGWAASKMGEG